MSDREHVVIDLAQATELLHRRVETDPRRISFVGGDGRQELAKSRRQRRLVCRNRSSVIRMRRVHGAQVETASDLLRGLPSSTAGAMENLVERQAGQPGTDGAGLSAPEFRERRIVILAAERLAVPDQIERGLHAPIISSATTVLRLTGAVLTGEGRHCRPSPACTLF